MHNFFALSNLEVWLGFNSLNIFLWLIVWLVKLICGSTKEPQNKILEWKIPAQLSCPFHMNQFYLPSRLVHLWPGQNPHLGLIDIDRWLFWLKREWGEWEMFPEGWILRWQEAWLLSGAGSSGEVEPGDCTAWGDMDVIWEVAQDVWGGRQWSEASAQTQWMEDQGREAGEGVSSPSGISSSILYPTAGSHGLSYLRTYLWDPTRKTQHFLVLLSYKNIQEG